jgi:hypothetical protein
MPANTPAPVAGARPAAAVTSAPTTAPVSVPSFSAVPQQVARASATTATPIVAGSAPSASAAKPAATPESFGGLGLAPLAAVDAVADLKGTEQLSTAAPNAAAKTAPGAAPPNSPTPPKSPAGVAEGQQQPKPKADAKPENQNGIKLVSVKNETGGSTHLVLNRHGATIGETHEALPATPKTAAPKDTRNANSRNLSPTPRVASSQNPGSSARHQLKGMDTGLAESGQASGQKLSGTAPLAHRGKTQTRKFAALPTPGMHA